jgi:signal transduction histidine kinase
MVSSFTHLSLSRRFLIASLPILLLGMAAVGYWISTTIERSVVGRIGSMTSLYVDSFVAPHLQHLSDGASGGSLDSARRAALDSLLAETPLGKKIVAFKIWDRNGRILYSTDAAMIGRSFPVGEGLAAALAGNVHSEISNLSEAENANEGLRWQRLIETYSPVRAYKVGTVLAAAEFYQLTDDWVGEVRAAQLKNWLVVAATMLVMYALMFWLVRRGSKIIDAQRRELRGKVAELSDMVAQNRQLGDKVRRAAVHTSELNERFLHRISSDLHDGPGQDMALALMRFEGIVDSCGRCPGCGGGKSAPQEDLQAVHNALQSALADLRSISLGLQLPEIDQLSSHEIAARAVRDFERKSGTAVSLVNAGDAANLPLPVKIALYRLIQESLANGLRHGESVSQCVAVANTDGMLAVEISDNGKGFDPQGVDNAGHLGLDGMRERVEILGGSFQLQTAPGHGTTVRATLPLELNGMEYE